MREIVLDTETTGIDPSQGHRIIEIGALEILNQTPSGGQLHIYINPEREIDAGAVAIHGLTNEFLDDKPVFADIVDDFLAFIGDSMMVIHNAPFDMGFINAELARLDRPTLPMSRATDTLTMARRNIPEAGPPHPAESAGNRVRRAPPRPLSPLARSRGQGSHL